jgi:hypothetical protein
MSMLNGKAATLPTARTDPANGAILLAPSLIALAMILPSAAGARAQVHTTANPVAAVATVTTSTSVLRSSHSGSMAVRRRRRR